ncbi:MAG: APC family permease [Halobacteriota archaeon]
MSNIATKMAAGQLELRVDSVPDSSSGQKLDFFDVTNLVIGAAVGADIYVVAAVGSADLGPANLLAWIVAGVFIMVIAINFAKCAAVIKKPGGSYAYVREVWGDFPGFVVGWAFWLAEVAGVAVFLVAFVQYLGFFFPALTWFEQAAIKAALAAAIAYSIIRGTKAAGRTNDTLTIAKLAPLLILVLVGALYLGTHVSATAANFVPFAPLGFSQFFTALVLIFWAYAGFEVGTIPSDNVEDPEKTLPKAMVLGMVIVTLFYVAVNVIVVGAVHWTTLADSQTPLILTASTVFSFTAALSIVGAAILGIGALLTVSGSDESGSFSLSMLSRTLARDGWFPRIFDEEHPRYHTPYKGIVIQSAIAFGASLIAGVNQLILFVVFNLVFVYFMTCLAVFALQRKGAIKTGESRTARALNKALPFAGMIVCVIIIAGIDTLKIIFGVATVLVAVPLYVAVFRHRERERGETHPLSEEEISAYVERTKHVFLGYLFSVVHQRFHSQRKHR